MATLKTAAGDDVARVATMSIGADGVARPTSSTRAAAAAVRHRTLVANTPMTISVPAASRGVGFVEVVNVDGAAAVYYRLDASAPTVAGDDCEVLPAAITGQELAAPVDGSGGTSVTLISAGTPRVAVRFW